MTAAPLVAPTASAIAAAAAPTASAAASAAAPAASAAAPAASATAPEKKAISFVSAPARAPQGQPRRARGGRGRQAPPSGGAAIVRLLDAGAEPRADLSYAVAKGPAPNLGMAMDMSVRMKASGKQNEAKLPRMGMTL